MAVLVRRYSLDGERTVEVIDTCPTANGFDVQEGTLLLFRAPEAKTKGDIEVIRVYASGEWITAGYCE